MDEGCGRAGDHWPRMHGCFGRADAYMDDPMTPKPSLSAEEIADKLFEDCRGASKANAFPFIVEALKAFGDRRYEEGRREAIEQCTSIASEHNGCVDIKCLSESNCGATISNQIYALLNEEKKERT